MAAVYTGAIPEGLSAKWGVSPCGQDEEDVIAFGSFDTADEAHAFAGVICIGRDYTLVKLIDPDSIRPRLEAKS